MFGGLGVEVNYTEAGKLLTLAMQKGCVAAEGFLGFLYTSGQGVTRDLVRGFQMLNNAVEAGVSHPLLYSQLGFLYNRNQHKDIPIDKRKAFLLIKVAAENKMKTAQRVLAEMYWDGEVVKQDKKLAKKWFAKAAMNGCQISTDALTYLDI